MDGFVIRSMDNKIKPDPFVPSCFEGIEAAKNGEKWNARFDNIIIGLLSHSHFEVLCLMIVNAFRCPLPEVGLVSVKACSLWAYLEDISTGIALSLQVGGLFTGCRFQIYV